MLRTLVLDFGGPVLLSPFEVVPGLESRLGVTPGTWGWTGPFDPARDRLWRRVAAREINEPQYWEIRAEQIAPLTGCCDVRQLMSWLYPSEAIGSFIRREASETVRAAKAAGLRTAVLTNDLASFFGADWISRVGFLNEVEAVVDGSLTGFLKPDPEAYRLVLDSVQSAAEDALFVDDLPPNVEGARAIGMTALHFDVTRPSESYREIARLLGLTQTGAHSIGL